MQQAYESFLRGDRLNGGVWITRRLGLHTVTDKRLNFGKDQVKTLHVGGLDDLGHELKYWTLSHGLRPQVVVAYRVLVFEDLRKLLKGHL